MNLYLLIPLLEFAILFSTTSGYVINNVLPNSTDVGQSKITTSPDLHQGVLFKRDTNTCGYITGNPNSPDTCSSPFACQWYTSAAGYPGQKFCTTDNYLVTANYGDFCLDNGNTACADTSSCYSRYGPWQTCENSKVPYCVTVVYASGPGDVIEYTSYYCTTNTVSRTQVIYFEATTTTPPAKPTTQSVSTLPPSASSIISATLPSSSETITPTPTTTPTLATSSHGLDTGSIIGIVTAVIAVIAIFAGAFTHQFQYWVLYAVPNALCVQQWEPEPGTELRIWLDAKKAAKAAALGLHSQAAVPTAQRPEW